MNIKFERWLSIDGYEDYYISNTGKVKSEKSNKILKPSGSPYKTKVTLYKDGKRKTNYVPRLVADHFIRKVKDDEIVVLKGDTNDFSVNNISIRPKENEIERKQYLSSDLVYLLIDVIECYNDQTLNDSHIKALSKKVNEVTHKTYIKGIEGQLSDYCEQNGISIKQIKSPSRKSKIVNHRKKFSLQSTQKGFKLTEIGKVLGDRHHTTILNYLK